MTPALRLRRLAVEAGGRRVVGPVDLDLPAGTVTAVVGPNGCGKSTLLSVLYRARRAASGTAEVLGRDLATLPLRESARLVAALPQEEHPELDFTVAEIASMALPSGNHASLAPALRLAGVEHLADRGVLGLSGGERQRTLIARMLAQDTPVLVLDEPTNHLDLRHQLRLMAVLRRIANTGRTVVAALHDLNLAMEADHVVLMSEGLVRAAGPPEEVLAPAGVEEVFGVRPTPVGHPRTGSRRLLFDAREESLNQATHEKSKHKR